MPVTLRSVFSVSVSATVHECTRTLGFLDAQEDVLLSVREACRFKRLFSLSPVKFEMKEHRELYENDWPITGCGM